MIRDTWTMMLKEWKELLIRRGRLRGGLLSLLVVVAFLGIVPPMQQGSDWVTSPIVLFLSGWVSFLLVTNVVTDSFAGERERHTLETLLATCLSDRAILFGKICTAISYGWCLTTLTLLIGLITVNVAFGHGEILFYQGVIGWGGVGLSLAGAALAASAGVLVSLRAPTVRQAQQTLSLAAMLLPLALYGLAQSGHILPVNWKARFAQAVATTSTSTMVCIAIATLAVLDIGLLIVAMLRFQRNRLILN